MTVSHVERNNADTRTFVFYDPNKEPAKVRLNALKFFGHTPAGLGAVVTGRVMAILRNSALTWDLRPSRDGLDCLALSGARP